MGTRFQFTQVTWHLFCTCPEIHAINVLSSLSLFRVQCFFVFHFKICATVCTSITCYFLKKVNIYQHVGQFSIWTRMLISIVSCFICRCLSSLFKELWPFENRKMYRNVLKIHFSNGQNSLENVSISLKLSWQMLLWILWNSQKIDSRL